MKVSVTLDTNNYAKETGMDLSSLYTVGQVADYLHVSRSTVYSLARRGHLASVSVGRHKRFTAQHVKDYLNTHGRVIVVPATTI